MFHLDVTAMNVTNLLLVAQSYAPNDEAQMQVSGILWDSQKAGDSIDQQILVLVTLLNDGLRHGNWPWTEGN